MYPLVYGWPLQGVSLLEVAARCGRFVSRLGIAGAGTHIQSAMCDLCAMVPVPRPNKGSGVGSQLFCLIRYDGDAPRGRSGDRAAGGGPARYAPPGSVAAARAPEPVSGHSSVATSTWIP